ncbi:signal peptide peptidase SppA [Tautonia sociabilis]|uniref:Signal peptide peptidase SppA n=1 Tax=Tautonia sociabilis TaxID=2080755 RepID=A0A432MGI3_9BACT|nr:signal peptide peptidase SppA [Tautonia sociabilis]RUL85609.1 signal peptide peptidase SppA [Tautonia sociabilis]
MNRAIAAWMLLLAPAWASPPSPLQELEANRAQAKPAAEETKKETPKPPKIVDLTLKGTLDEAPSPLGLDGSPIEANLPTVLDRIATAAQDDEVKGLVLRFRDLAVGPGKANELRSAIAAFRTSGKPVVALLEMAANADYWVASAADRVVMPESGSLMLSGLAAEVTFFKGLFDKLGVQPDYLQVGQYKGAAEPYTRTEMSAEFREELTAVLTDELDLLVNAIAEGRGLDPAVARALVDDGPYTANRAVAVGLVDELAYPDQVSHELAEQLGVETVALDKKYGEPEPEDYSGFAGLMKLLQELSGEGKTARESKAPKVAVIYATGVIQPGKSSPGSILGEAVLGSDTIVEQIQRAERDDTVKAIVLRVDSPGGSALASDLIWRAVVEAKKPVVASMSDTAASGGYYISMGCDAIYAEPGTLTGSIGVVGGKFALGGLLEKVGVTTDTVTVGENGALFSPFSPFNDEQERSVRALMEDTYRQFVSKAADGREMTDEALETLAAGRVYSGRKAEELGLVDALGTLDDAIARAKELAGIAPETQVERLVLPEPKSIFEALSEAFEGTGLRAPGVGIEAALPEPVRSIAARAEAFRRLVEREPAVLILPFELRIR